jgi:hypothetical protein
MNEQFIEEGKGRREMCWQHVRAGQLYRFRIEEIKQKLTKAHGCGNLLEPKGRHLFMSRVNVGFCPKSNKELITSRAK